VAFALDPSAAVVNAIVPFIEPAQMDRAEEHVPGSAAEGLEADRQRRQDVRDIHPALIPPNAAVGRDAPDLEVLRVGDRPESGHVPSIRGRIERRGPALLQRFVGPHLVEGMPERIEAPLLGTEGVGWQAG
jgi:hypothetical protein